MMNPLQFGTRLHFVSPEKYQEIYMEHYLKQAPQAHFPWTTKEIIKTTDIGHTRFIDCCTAGYIREPEKSTTVFHLKISAITDEFQEIEKRLQEAKLSEEASPFLIGASQDAIISDSSYKAFGRIKCLIDGLFQKPFSFFFGHHRAKWISDFCHFMGEDTTYIKTYSQIGHVNSPEQLVKVFASSRIAPQDELWINGQKVDKLPTK